MQKRAFPMRGWLRCGWLRFMLLCTALLMTVPMTALVSPAFAQIFPSRPITLVCPFAPGGSADIMARLVAQKLGDSLGAPVLVENRPGASSAALTELLSGRIDMLLEAPILSLPYVKNGKLRALGVTSHERVKSLPDLPALAEVLPGYEVISYIGVGVTGGTPEPIVNQLNAELRKLIDHPDTIRRLTELGGEPQSNTPEEMRRFVENELRKWRSVIDMRKIER